MHQDNQNVKIELIVRKIHFFLILILFNIKLWKSGFKSKQKHQVALKYFLVKSTSIKSIIITSLSRTNGSDGSFDGSLMVSRNQVINQDQENMFKILSFGSKPPKHDEGWLDNQEPLCNNSQAHTLYSTWPNTFLCFKKPQSFWVMLFYKIFRSCLSLTHVY